MQMFKLFNFYDYYIRNRFALNENISLQTK